MKFPVLIINFKAYAESTGLRAVELAKVAESVAKDLGVEIVVAPQYTDLYRVAVNTSLRVFAQSADPVMPGAYTGHVTLESILESGASGVILNHSERPLRLNELAFLVERAKALGLDSVVCAPTSSTASAVSKLRPTAVAVEPPELIGTGRAVSRERPELIRDSLNVVDVPLIVGAGIESGDDVKRSIELGAQGVLVASAIVKAQKWREKILEMARHLAGD